ncbi:hypothetical protein LTR86_001273 [Recurvomyces mirabilis]|nr:hypothetical protein LTR86_001273 [Recurvomyces mirabilis]
MPVAHTKLMSEELQSSSYIFTLPSSEQRGLQFLGFILQRSVLEAMHGALWGGPSEMVLLLPTIFAQLHEKTLYIFGGVNVLSILVVWALYPETNQRTLEEMNLVFAADSIWNWDAEKNFALLKEQNPGLVHAARQASISSPESGVKDMQEKQKERSGSLDV